MKITIEGPQGSGKTSIAELLRAALSMPKRVLNDREAEGIMRLFPEPPEILEEQGGTVVLRFPALQPGKTTYPTETEKLLADLATWRNSAVSRDRKIEALHSLAGRANDLVQDFKPAPGLPAAVPMVPLGKNVTRDGREVWVVSLTGGSAVEPLICFLKNGGDWYQVYYPTTGAGETVHSSAELIGHLPPEPPKPRELWIKKIMLMGALQPHEEAAMSLGEPADAEARGYKLFREVLP